MIQLPDMKSAVYLVGAVLAVLMPLGLWKLGELAFIVWSHLHWN